MTSVENTGNPTPKGQKGSPAPGNSEDDDVILATVNPPTRVWTGSNTGIATFQLANVEEIPKIDQPVDAIEQTGFGKDLQYKIFSCK